MKKNSIRNFLSRLKILASNKSLFLKLDYNKINKFLAEFLTKEGYLRGFFLVDKKKDISKMYVILKYNEKDQPSICFIEKKNVLSNKSQFIKQKKLRKYCNGLGLTLIYSINGFITSELAFWLKLGGKKIFELK